MAVEYDVYSHGYITYLVGTHTRAHTHAGNVGHMHTCLQILQFIFYILSFPRTHTDASSPAFTLTMPEKYRHMHATHVNTPFPSILSFHHFYKYTTHVTIHDLTETKCRQRKYVSTF